MSGENREPQAVPEIGRSLESTRKSRDLSLWEVEQETRIRSRYLRDLEREEFDVLPAVYVLGSLKTYPAPTSSAWTARPSPGSSRPA